MLSRQAPLPSMLMAILFLVSTPVKASLVNCPGSRGRRNACRRRSQHLVKGFGGCSPAKGLSRSGIERRGHGCERVRAVRAQVGAFGEVLPQQPVGVLVRAALPWTVRIAEVDLHASVDS